MTFSEAERFRSSPVCNSHALVDRNTLRTQVPSTAWSVLSFNNSHILRFGLFICEIRDSIRRIPRIASLANNFLDSGLSIDITSTQQLEAEGTLQKRRFAMSQYSELHGRPDCFF